MKNVLLSINLACKHDCLSGKKEGEECGQSVDIIT